MLDARLQGLFMLVVYMCSTTEERHAERKRLKQFEDNKGRYGIIPGAIPRHLQSTRFDRLYWP
jgi:hypothetical protein